MSCALFATMLLALSPATAQDATPEATPLVEEPSEGEIQPFAGTVENGIRTITVVETAISDVVVDLLPVGDSMGDLLVFANPAFDESMETLVGVDQGYCVRVRPVTGAWECTWTMFLADGQIVAQGPFYDARETSTLAITGGTGAYAGARGEMVLTVVSATEFMFSYRIIEE